MSRKTLVIMVTGINLSGLAERNTMYQPPEGRQYTNQEIIDRVWDFFITQGNPQSNSTEVHSQCMYAHPKVEDGGCAVGCLLSYEEAKEWDKVPKDYLYGTGIAHFYHNHYEMYSKHFTKEQYEFLNDLQNWHDYRFSVDTLKDIIQIYDLTVPE